MDRVGLINELNDQLRWWSGPLQREKSFLTERMLLGSLLYSLGDIKDTGNVFTEIDVTLRSCSDKLANTILRHNYLFQSNMKIVAAVAKRHLIRSKEREDFNCSIEEQLPIQHFGAYNACVLLLAGWKGVKESFDLNGLVELTMKTLAGSTTQKLAMAQEKEIPQPLVTAVYIRAYLKEVGYGNDLSTTLNESGKNEYFPIPDEIITELLSDNIY